MRPLLFGELVLDSRHGVLVLAMEPQQELTSGGLNCEPCGMIEVRLKTIIITLSKLEVMIKANRMMLARARQQIKEERNPSLQKNRETQRR